MRAVASPTVAALAATLPFCAPAEKRVKINEQIRPLLNAQCVSCHGTTPEDFFRRKPMFTRIDVNGLRTANTALSWQHVRNLKKLTSMKLLK